eukprot:TRINITY_DN29680_c0_g1_i1.p1 TRINITY_DN29680_c0_g1~~TRINITY_DN29680_c0_g1_i1.p1  ORF type:complete len:807 (+),score=150.47 TRINITY_DN29680_c0_g1_i1:89-2509(+)
MEPLEQETGQGNKQTQTWKERVVKQARFGAAVVLHGVGTGIIGIFIALLIRNVQEISYGDDHGGFLEIAVQARPWRRICAVFAGGVFGAVTWYWLRGVDPSIVSVEESLAGAWMPPHVTIVNAMIQDIVVASGGSFGREAAPREIAAMWGGALAWLLDVADKERKVLVACGTGAGLAAVYSVPISGTLYTVEHVLKWDLSAGSVVPAVVTSFLATWVASWVVEDTGLYAMPRYSYEWPSIAMIVWAIMIGPASAGAAVLFRRLVKAVEKLKPHNRLQVKFEEASVGESVSLLCQENFKEVRKEAEIINVSSDEIIVKFENEASEVDYDLHNWVAAEPEGARDWKILVAMPTVSLVLGIMAHDFPTLLGNGRALAEVAIERQQNPGFLGMLLFLKAGMTAAAIGSGAAGGILTPSVALGATLGAVIGEAFQALAPSLAPQHDQSMSVVGAAAFLSVTMNSPVTGLWLLVEFSAQGIRRDDLLLLLKGDFSGIILSKLAVGMLVPMTIAVLGAQLALKYGAQLAEYASAEAVKKAPASPALKRQTSARRKSSWDIDIKATDDDHHDDDAVLDEVTKASCYACFRAGLLANTFVTVGIAAAAPACHEEDIQVSMGGVLVAAVLGLCVWSYMVYCSAESRKDGFTQMASVTEESVDATTGSNQPYSERTTTPLVQALESAGTVSETPGEVTVFSPKLHKSHSWSHLAWGAGSAILCSAVGAVAPLAPWTLHIWQDQGGGITALVASASLAVAASACGAAALLLRPKHRSQLMSVLLEALVTASLAGLATAAGFAWGKFGAGPLVYFSMTC